MAPNRLYGQQKKQKRRSIDDDPFWDSWEDEETSPEPVARRRPKPSKKYKQLAGSVDDPFGYDGFGDTWEEKKPRARRIIRRDSSPVVLPEDLVALEDAPDGSDSWCTSAVRKKSWSFEDHLKALTAKMAAIDAERDQKAALEAKKKAAKEAAEAKATAKKAMAEAEWNQQVQLAKDSIALADPAKALNLLRSLSQNIEVVQHIDQSAKKEFSEMYTALYNHWEQQQQLTQALAHLPDGSDDCSDYKDSNNEKSNSEESDVSDSITVEKESGDTVRVVDRLPSYQRNSKTLLRDIEVDETGSRQSLSTAGDGTTQVCCAKIEATKRIGFESSGNSPPSNSEENTTKSTQKCRWKPESTGDENFANI